MSQPSPTHSDPWQPEEELHAAHAHTQEKPRSLLEYPATYLLVGINVAVFLIMLTLGSGPVHDVIRAHAWTHLLTAEFDAQTLLRFGASASPNVVGGQWWRLITSTFVHVTILHIVLNMWCLWNLGLFGEPLLGRQGLIWVYLLTGTAGMLLSLTWSLLTRQPALVAGASGAVFGIAGILIVLLSNRKLSLPWEELRALRRQVIFFAVANLAIGIGPSLLEKVTPNLPRIDNSAHIGGFAAGLALGLPLFPRMTSGRSSYRARQRATFVIAALLLGLVAYGVIAAGRGRG